MWKLINVIVHFAHREIDMNSEMASLMMLIENRMQCRWIACLHKLCLFVG